LADTNSTAKKAETKSNVVSMRGRRGLFGEVAAFSQQFNSLELFDVAQLVIDSPATRADLRMIEENDDEVAQCIETRLDALLGVDWRLEGGSQENNDFLTEQVRRHYDTLVTNAFHCRLYGYNVQERIWGFDGDRIVVERVSEKPFEWFIPKRDNTLWFRPKQRIILAQSFNGNYGIDGIEVDTEFKFLLTRHKPTWKNPRGVALLAYLFWPWFYRKANWQFWLQFLERNGQPLLVGTGPDPAQMAEQLATAVQDAVIGIPVGSTVDAVSTTNKGEAFKFAEEGLVRRIEKLLLGQTLTSDAASNGGARAQAQVHNDVRLDKTVSDVKLITPTIQNYVDALVALNFPASRPVRYVAAIDRGLEAARATRDATLINTGTVSLTKEYYQREYGFQEGDVEVVGIEQQAAQAKAAQEAQKKQQAQQSQTDQQSTATALSNLYQALAKAPAALAAAFAAVQRAPQQD
jgi:hypothetical protein